MKDEIVGTRIGIYDVLYECKYKAKDGHKLYHVKCSVCGRENDMLKACIGRTKSCRHIRRYWEKEIEIRKCLNCGKEISTNNISRLEYEERKFCCSSCSATYNNKIRNVNKKTNTNKGKNVSKKKESKKGNLSDIIVNNINESNGKFCLNCNTPLKSYQNKYCNRKCQTEYQQKQWEEKWLSGEISGFSETDHWGTTPKRIRTYLFNKHDSKCARCGWGETNPYSNRTPLEVEHIDGNYKNNRPENLTLLCPNCHSLTKTYRGLNLGHGRGKTWRPIINDNTSAS